MQTITVFGNGGTITARADTGDVLTYEPEALDEQNTGYADIHRFNVSEWRHCYPGEDITANNIDILDIGYWYNVDDDHTLYEGPDDDWRRECKEISRTQSVVCVPGLIGLTVVEAVRNGDLAAIENRVAAWQLDKQVRPYRHNPALTILCGIGVGLLFLALAGFLAWLVYGFFYTE